MKTLETKNNLMKNMLSDVDWRISNLAFILFL